MRTLNTFGARTSHKQTQTHKTHNNLDLGEATTFPLIIYSVLGHRTSTQISFCFGTPKWEFRNSQSWDFCNFGAHNFVCRPQIEMRSKAKL